MRDHDKQQARFNWKVRLAAKPDEFTVDAVRPGSLRGFSRRHEY